MEYIYINDLLEQYPDKTILEINDILRENGVNNKLIKIKVECKICGCELITTPGTYRKQKHFYCENHTVHKPSGKNSAFYNRVKVNCSTCGKEMEIIPYEQKRKNKFGDSNHFCSQQCYWNFRSAYYRGEKGAMYNHQYTEEQKLNCSRGVVKRLKKTNITNTTIQLAVNEMLDDLGVRYEREYSLEFYSCDNFLNDFDMIIEVMGDYWHGNPLKYHDGTRPMNKIQTKTILKDKQKRSYIKNHYGYSILNLWESDIRFHPDKCKALINEFIQNNGRLENYHSFNYSYEEEYLVLNESLITPYQEMHSSQYTHLLKDVS